MIHSDQSFDLPTDPPSDQPLSIISHSHSRSRGVRYPTCHRVRYLASSSRHKSAYHLVRKQENEPEKDDAKLVNIIIRHRLRKSSSTTTSLRQRHRTPASRSVHRTTCRSTLMQAFCIVELALWCCIISSTYFFDLYTYKYVDTCYITNTLK